MESALSRPGKTANRLLNRLGLQVVRTTRYGDLLLYPEVERPKTPLYLNIGAGRFYHPFWHNLDNPSSWYADAQRDNVHISHDLTSDEPMPVASETLTVAYTSHVVEHIRDRDVGRMFADVYRCLQPNGFFRITCPDIDLYYDAYNRRDLLFPWPSKDVQSVEQRFLMAFATALMPGHPDTRCPKYTDGDIRRVFSNHSKEEALDMLTKQVPVEVQQAFPGNHMNWYNERKLLEFLWSAGFTDVRESRYGQSRCPVLRNTRLFDRKHPEVSLYIECQK